MPIEINEVNSTVEVEPGHGSGEGGQGTEAPVLAQQRWLEIARRQDQLAQRTSAWGFDD